MSWKPVNDKHAIERVMFTVTLTEPLPAKLLTAMGADLAKKAAAIGINELIQLSAPQPQIIVNGFVQWQAAQASFGQILRSTKDGVVQEELVYNPVALSFSATVYDHWSEFINRTEECLADSVEKIIGATDIRDVRLEYWDLFNLPKDSDSADPSELINPESELIPTALKSEKDSWHTHLGFYRSDRKSNSRRTLVNINIDVSVNADGQPPVLPPGPAMAQARIHTLGTTQSNEGFTGWRDIREVVEYQHTLLKSVIGNCIHPDLSKAISLDAVRFEP